MNGQTLVVSIVTWNHADSIEACLESLFRQTQASAKIYVYDNASTDNTISILHRFRGQLEIIASDRNRGFCEGHNSIINSTNSEFVLLVNPDVVLRPDYIERAVAVMRHDAGIGAVCGLLLQNSGSEGEEIVDGTGLILTRSRRFILRDHGRRLGEMKTSAGEVFGCDGALPLFRRSFIEGILVNGFFFDPAFFAHKEDQDVAWRGRLLGWKTIFEPSCVALHPRLFRPGDLGLRRRLASELKYHTVKNDLLMLLNNEQAAAFWHDFFSIVPRRLAIAFYTLILEPRSFAAYWYVFRNLWSILAQRKGIQRRRRVSAKEIRLWIT
jgi:GT2 family glycosyltransferase